MIWLFLFEYQNSGTGLAACPRLHYTTIVTAACWSSCCLLRGESEYKAPLIRWFLNMQMNSRDKQMLKSLRVFMRGAFSSRAASRILSRSQSTVFVVSWKVWRWWEVAFVVGIETSWFNRFCRFWQSALITHVCLPWARIWGTISTSHPSQH